VWPERVILDEDEFRFTRPGAPRGQRAFYVLANYGYQGSDLPLVTSVEAVPALSTAAWVRHLQRLGGAPDRVVTDGGRPVVGGAAKAWPDAELRRCEYHLARNLLDVLPQRVRVTRKTICTSPHVAPNAASRTGTPTATFCTHAPPRRPGSPAP